jgi:hypothetical protein
MAFYNLQTTFFSRDILCDFCQVLSPNLKHFFGDTAAGEALQSIVKEYCILSSDDPGTQQLCFALLDGIVMRLYQIVDVSVMDNTICNRLTVCDYSQDLPPLQPNLIHEACVLFLENYQPYFLSKTTLPHLQDVVKNFCPDFPTAAERAQCESFYSFQLPSLFQKVASFFANPNATCSGDFQSTAAAKPTKYLPLDLPSTFHNENDSCDSCKKTAQIIQPLFASTQTLDNLQRAYHDFCNRITFPGFINVAFNESITNCKKNFDDWIPMTWKLLGVEMVDPEKFCIKLTQCPNTTQPMVVEQKVSNAPLSPISEDVSVTKLCQACRLVADYLKPVINANSTLTRLETLYQRMCSTMPYVYILECENNYKNSAMEAYHYLKDEFDSGDYVCVEVLTVCAQQSSVQLSGKVAEEEGGHI